MSQVISYNKLHVISVQPSPCCISFLFPGVMLRIRMKLEDAIANKLYTTIEDA